MGSGPDALDLERIGRALADEFAEEIGPEACRECGFVTKSRRQPSFVSMAAFRHPQAGRVDGERLVQVLDELGFRIVRSDG